MFGWMWKVGIHSAPAGAGAISATIWNRMDVHLDPPLCVVLFISWARFSWEPGSPAEFLSQVRENAKLLRTGLPIGAQFIRNCGPFAGYLLCVSVLTYV